MKRVLRDYIMDLLTALDSLPSTALVEGMITSISSSVWGEVIIPSPP